MLLLAACRCVIVLLACLSLNLLRNLLLDLEFFENYISSLHYALLQMGGFRRMGPMTLQQRDYMFGLPHNHVTRDLHAVSLSL